MNQSTRMLRLPDVIQKTGMSRSQIYRLIDQNAFPSQIQLSDRLSGWIEAEVECWLQERIDQSRRRRGNSATAA